jgi:pyridoxine/pyridoxamine 5'-phosphate oxidase
LKSVRHGWYFSRMPTTEQRDYYASRAAEARALATAEQDPATLAALQELADSYDKLVAEADRIALIRNRMAQY